MCGVAGVLQSGSEEVVRGALHAAADRLRHRGPDAQTVWTGEGIGLAHTRLAIIDRAHGDQPMFSADERYVVVFNGEIYNHRELRRELEAKGHRFRTACDTEVLLHLYERLGPDMVPRLRGMFAFAIVDLSDGSALLARDRFGKKPLYLARMASSGLCFGSTLDALRCLLPETPEVDRDAILQYLMLQYVPSPMSPYKGIDKLPPGHFAVWTPEGLEIRRYWRPPLRAASPPPAADRREAAEELRNRIREAVSVRLESDVPVGVFLSGGLDSSAVVAEMAALGASPTTYSIGFQDRSFDESQYARQVATHIGAEHHELTTETDIPELFASFVRNYDEPFADSSALATLAVSRAASEHVTVVLTGDGGDELLGGYERYRLFRRAAAMGGSLGGLGRIAGSILGALPPVAGRHLSVGGRWVNDPWAGYRDSLFHFTPREAAGLMDASTASPAAVVDRLDRLCNEGGRSPLALLWVDQQTYLPDDLLTKVDRASMASSLEARSPLLDHLLSEFCAALPESWLFDERGGKRLLREAYAGVLPQEILMRPKMGFGVPLDAWLRLNLRPIVEELLLSRCSPIWSVLSFEAGTPIVRRYLNEGRGSRWKVWNLLALAGWASERLGSSLTRREHWPTVART